MEKEIRTSTDAPTVTGRTISGYAIVFNSKSEVMKDKDGVFIEVILPSAVNEELICKSDIKMVLEHNPDRLLARSKKGKGTLKYEIDSHGVRYEFEAPHTADGDFAVEMVKRGDIVGASFAFNLSPSGVRREKYGNIPLRYIHRMNYLFDFSLVADPAYSATDANVRHKQGHKERSRNLERLAAAYGLDWKAKGAAQRAAKSKKDKMRANYIAANMTPPAKYK